MNNLTLLIPAKEESESLPLVLDELKKYNCKKLVVLDENDKITIDSIKNYDCEILFQKNLGYGSALVEGINKIETEYLCIFNADGSFNPIYLKTMLSECKDDNDFVFASRYSLNGKTEDDTFLTAIGNGIFSAIGKVFFGLKIDDILFTFVMGKTESYKKLELKNHDFRFCVELPIKAKRKNMNYINHGSSERKRFMGFKKVSEFKDGFLILLELIRLFVIRKN
tara:strand:+ start:968 stop:1639 length:672 start_codon:yes stop_codon:yes gene_type:complete